eukprot:TRINITY_DN1999_c1_g1_i2.p1 TRINITY_DN1999_c1_g1~~TRINITY_DN1999_c1_g1_i2.p1  ORF type:complete len:200 (-),score=62.89 TRINITY_DN1999_c1_g1_i2:641-1240(-)
MSSSAADDYRDELIATANTISTPGKGILAADESTGTIGKRLASINVENTLENRVAYRELLFTTPSLGDYISGAITYEETLLGNASDGTPFVELLQKADVIPGIKTDKGVKIMAGTYDETTTQGIDDLEKRCQKYYDAGARFCKWYEAVFFQFFFFQFSILEDSFFVFSKVLLTPFVFVIEQEMRVEDRSGQRLPIAVGH